MQPAHVSKASWAPSPVLQGEPQALPTLPLPVLPSDPLLSEGIKLGAGGTSPGTPNSAPYPKVTGPIIGSSQVRQQTQGPQLLRACPGVGTYLVLPTQTVCQARGWGGRHLVSWYRDLE